MECVSCHAKGSLRMDYAQGFRVCILCGHCDDAGHEMGIHYAQWPRGESERMGEFRAIGYRPKYYLRERLHNAGGFAGNVPRNVRLIVHDEFETLCSRVPSVRTWVKDPINAKYVFVELLRSLAKRSDFDRETTRVFRSPTLKERWTYFWTLETHLTCPDDELEGFEDSARAIHSSLMTGFPHFKSDVWAKRKNFPFLPYVLGVGILRKFGKDAFMRIAAWWLPPKTPQTLRKCRLFVKKLTETGWLLPPPSTDEEDYPKEVFDRMQEGRRIAKLVLDALTRPSLTP